MDNNSKENHLSESKATKNLENNDVQITETLRFKCAFSEDAIRHNTVMTLTAIVPTIAILSYLFIIYEKWIGFAFVLVIIAIIVYNQLYVIRLAKGSYLEITPDGTLKCRYYGRAEASYPINEIKSIEETSLKDAYRKHAIIPAAFHSKGRDIYPDTGVLITFNRSWIKSVSPVFFNPGDIAGFIAAIKTRI